MSLRGTRRVGVTRNSRKVHCCAFEEIVHLDGEMARGFRSGAKYISVEFGTLDRSQL